MRRLENILEITNKSTSSVPAARGIYKGHTGSSSQIVSGCHRDLVALGIEVMAGLKDSLTSQQLIANNRFTDTLKEF